MSSCVAELDAVLQSMLAMKAPGVSGSKITGLVELCNANIQSESVLIQKIFTHFKKAPGTHKLGVLYVVDSVTRHWVDQARKAGQEPSAAAPYGTYGAGVHRVTELLPMLMTDIINSAPEDQKGKIKKLVDIWERGNTFPQEMLQSFNEKLNAPPSNVLKSTTPPGSPPKDFIPLNEQPVVTPGQINAAPATDTSAILKALADMAKTNTGAPGVPLQASSSNVTNTQNTFPQNLPSSVNQALHMPPVSQPVGAPGANAAAMFAGMNNAPGNFAPNMPNGQPMMQVPPAIPLGNGAPPMTPEIQQQLQILQALQKQGIPQEQWATVLQVVMANGAGLNQPNSNAAPQPSWEQNGNFGGNDDQSRDRNGFNGNVRSPQGRYRNPRSRSRSRSPSRWDKRGNSPPRRRDSPVYGEYGRDSRDNDRGGYGRSDRGRGNAYRQRSPDRHRRSPSPRRSNNGSTLPEPGPKFVDYDPSLRQGMIKVLSRTLFVGGVTCSEENLRHIFSKFGTVQTCIVNVDKRHAFVKMLSRQDAQAARDGMERYKSDDMQLRTRWGVGFGPRDCSDYSTGVSVIPIAKLTDADVKWMLTAEYGGSGGKKLETGMVVEEPDIEIGAGVSSKAISRRMATDKGGNAGPRSSREPQFQQQSNNSRFRQPDRSQDRDNNPNHSTIGVPPAIPSFGFQFPNGMPMIHPGMFPPNMQPPPPGAN